MKVRFNLQKEARKALVRALGEITGQEPIFLWAPTFAYTVGSYTVDRNGAVDFGDADYDTVQGVLSALTAEGFTGSLEDTGCDAEPSEKKTITVDAPLLSETALDNLRKMIAGKAALIKKALGTDDLTVVRIGSVLHFQWFKEDSTSQELDAYKQFMRALCETAIKQKRVIAKEKPLDEGTSEKFAFRCFLLRLGFIGDSYKQARKILLAPMSGNGSHKSGDGKKGLPLKTAKSEGSENDGSDEAVSPLRCADCRYLCYYASGEMLTAAGEVVDISKRKPDGYTYYCLKTPRGFRKLKHTNDWNGSETPPKWCPLKCSASTNLTSND